MIERDKIVETLKSLLPKVTDESAVRIAEDIARDAETIMYSLIRQAVAQEREQLFRNSIKGW